jgi:ribosomal protein S18 acetylase RimI-like enzyme
VFDDRAEIWRARFASSNAAQFVVVAEDDGLLDGFACVYGADDPEWGSLLDNLHVRSERWRRGIGRELMRLAATWTAQRYPGGLYLWVLEKNDAARRFYERLGGRDIEAAAFEAPGGGQIDSRRYWWPHAAALAAKPGRVSQK